MLAKSDVRTYTKDEGNKGKVLVLGVSDGEKCYKLQSYDTKTYSRLALNNVVLLKNYIDKGRELVVTKQSNVFMSGGLTVPEDHWQTCRDIVRPPPAPIQKIVLALRSPHKTRTSIRGQLVKSTGQPVLILHTNIIAIIHDKDVCVPLSDDGIEYTCPAETLAAALGNNPHIELQSLTNEGPVRVQISVIDRDVKNIVVYED